MMTMMTMVTIDGSPQDDFSCRRFDVVAPESRVSRWPFPCHGQFCILAWTAGHSFWSERKQRDREELA